MRQKIITYIKYVIVFCSLRGYIPFVRFFDPNRPITKKRGQLPHWTQPGATYFVTFRLADSLPETKLRFLREEKEVWIQNHPPPLSFDEREEFSRLFSGRFDRWLDQGHGQCVLGLAEPRKITEDSLRYFDKKRYSLGEFVVMPNHVHVLATPLPLTRLRPYFNPGSRSPLTGSTNVWDESGKSGIVKASIILCTTRSSWKISSDTFATIRKSGKCR